jgi:signal transduction histidine kinase
MPEGRALVADSGGDIWLGLRNGDLARYRDGHAETFHFEHLPNSPVYQVALSSDGSVLGGTSYGLIGWSNGKQRTLGARNGLPCEAVNSFVEDSRGDVWIYMQCGLVQIERSDLQKWWADPNVKLQPRVFGVFDGFRAGIATPFERSAVRDRDGLLWFANGSVVQMVDPSHLVQNLTPPPVHLEQIIADHKMYLPSGGVRLPARTRDVEIDYTALSFTVPQKVRFRYRLEGRDPDWQDAGTRRLAFYTDLRPGAFRFRVIAANNSGVWNEAGAFLDFSIDPAYYQTTWFRASCVAAFFALLWALYRYRLYQIQQGFNANLEGRVDERTRIARELHDTLLQSFHGLIFRFQAADNLLPARPGDAKQTLESALEDSVQAITEARDAVHELRSFTVVTNDLAAAVTALGDELAAHHASSSPSQDPPRILVEVEGTPQDLNPTLRDEIYRIAGEAVRNAFIHSQARRIEVEIRYDDRELRVRIRDDGSGIDPSVLSHGGREGHWGLTGMRERTERIGGHIDLWSELGAGTEVELRIPASIVYRTSAGRGFRPFRK